MSDTRQGRFEIDLDEIERQLRRSAEAAPAPKSDPLAELARIVGQDDPFSGLFAEKPGASRQRSDGTSGPPQPAATGAPAATVPGRQPDIDVYAHEEDAVLADDRTPEAAGMAFDPVSEAYGSNDEAFEDEDFRPLAARRSRRGLVAVVLSIVVLVGAGAGVLAWRGGGIKLSSSGGPPPVIKADDAPLKVAPENPGGIEIPNQDRQIYQRSAPEGRARVVDRQEQPIDVKEASRTLPPGPTPTPTPQQPPSAAGAVPGQATVTAPTATAPSAASSPPSISPSSPVVRSGRSSVVQAALGEPRPVRTVVVRPDGTMLGGPSLAAADPAMGLVPSPGSLPPPIPVATVPVSLGQGASMTAPSTPADTGATPTGPAVSVLPPQRPRLAAASSAGTTTNPAAADAAPAGFTVQLGVRSTEQEARSAYTQAVGKYASELSGRSPVFARAEVGGKTVYRVRIAANSKADATSLCDKLKTAGAQCYVAGP